MRITESQLRRIVREEILRESLYDDWHGGSYSATGTPDPQRVWDKWVELGGLEGRRVFSYDLARELDLDDPSEIDYTGSGLMMRNGVVEEMLSPMREAKTKKRKYGGKEYKSSSGSVEAIRKHGGSAKKAVSAGAFDWADNPMAAAQAAHIVAMGEPTVAKRTNRKKG